MAKLKKGSAAAKAFMAKIRAAKGKNKVVKAKVKTKVGMDATANDIKVTSNVKNRTFTIKKNGTTYRTGKFSKPEFEELEYNTQNDWANFLRTQDNYSKVKTGAVKKVIPTKKATSMHKDTKSHNVNIRVVSGVNGSEYFAKQLNSLLADKNKLETDLMIYKQRIKEKVPFSPFNALHFKRLPAMIKSINIQIRESKKHIK